MSTEPYEGTVCFQDGWHHSVVADADGYDTPGERLVFEDGAYRAATDTDVSHNERYGQRFASIVMEDGTVTRVTADEYTKVQALLADLRGEEV